MKFICVCEQPIEFGSAVRFIGNHTDDHAAYWVVKATPESPKQSLGIACESAKARTAFMVEADYETVARWAASLVEKERD